MCPKCRLPLLAETRVCWACGTQQGWAAPRFTLEVKELEPGLVEEVVEMLQALVDEPRSAVAFVLPDPLARCSAEAWIQALSSLQLGYLSRVAERNRYSRCLRRRFQDRS